MISCRAAIFLAWCCILNIRARRAGVRSGAIEAENAAGLEASDVALPFVDLLVIIPSTVKETEKRIAIRHSWGKYVDLEGHCERCRSNRTIKILFGVARPEGEDRSIENETEIFQDLALLNLDQQADHYRKLTLKVRSCIEYAVQHFRFSLLLKVDTDSFIFMDRFLLLAEKKKLFGQEFGNPTNIYGGKFLHNHKPNASLASKWTDRTYGKLTGLEYFPAYAHGAGYILSPSLCRYIAEGLSEHAAKSDAWAAFPELQPLPNEDVSVGFWLQPVVHTKVEMPISEFPRGCRDGRKIIDHHVMPKLMNLRWKNLEETGDPCNKAAKQEEIFDISASKRDELDYTQMKLNDDES